MTRPPFDRGYHHGDLRETLLAAALESIAAEGTEKLSLRALARAAGVSPTAPYRHFPSKTCLLAALITRGFVAMRIRIEEARDAAGATPEERLQAVGLAYVRFALDNPTSYHLMFSTVLVDFSAYDDLRQAADAAYGVVLDVLAEVLAENRTANVTLSQAGAVAWSAVHGVSSLLLFGRRKQAPRNERSPLTSLAGLEEDTATALRLLMRGLVG
jgi:AcrR family transcriptional regulator